MSRVTQLSQDKQIKFQLISQGFGLAPGSPVGYLPCETPEKSLLGQKFSVSIPDTAQLPVSETAGSYQGRA